MRYLYTQSTCLAGRRLPRALVQCVLSLYLRLTHCFTTPLYRPVALPPSLLHKSCTEYATHFDHRQYPANSPISHTCAVVSLKPLPYFFLFQKLVKQPIFIFFRKLHPQETRRQKLIKLTTNNIGQSAHNRPIAQQCLHGNCPQIIEKEHWPSTLQIVIPDNVSDSDARSVLKVSYEAKY